MIILGLLYLFQVFCGDYFEHVMSWYAHKDDDNVLFLTYEEMKENNFDSIVKIGKFMGGKSAKFVKDPTNVEKIIELSSLGAMKKSGEGMMTKLANEAILTEGYHICRKGIIGDYKGYFSENQVERLKEKYEGKMKATYLMELWDEHLGFSKGQF